MKIEEIIPLSDAEKGAQERVLAAREANVWPVRADIMLLAAYFLRAANQLDGAAAAAAAAASAASSELVIMMTLHGATEGSPVEPTRH